MDRGQDTKPGKIDFKDIATWRYPSYTVMLFLIIGFLASYVGLIEWYVFVVGLVLLLLVHILMLSILAYCYAIGSAGPNLKTILIRFVVGLVIPIFCVVYIAEIDRTLTRAVVWTVDQASRDTFEEKAVLHSLPGDSFKYYRLSFGKAGRGFRWIVYDESNQVALEYMERSAEWWKVSKEVHESQGCLGRGKELYSNFYVQYNIC